MLTSKERKSLSGKGQKLEPLFQVGKNGLEGAISAQIGDALEARELVKVSILRNSDLVAKDVLASLCETLGAEPVSCVGGKVVLYRRSSRKDFKHIEF